MSVLLTRCAGTKDNLPQHFRCGCVPRRWQRIRQSLQPGSQSDHTGLMPSFVRLRPSAGPPPSDPACRWAVRGLNQSPTGVQSGTALAAAEGLLLNVHLTVSPRCGGQDRTNAEGPKSAIAGQRARLRTLAAAELRSPIWRASLQLVLCDGNRLHVCLLAAWQKGGGLFTIPPTPLIDPTGIACDGCLRPQSLARAGRRSARQALRLAL